MTKKQKDIIKKISNELEQYQKNSNIISVQEEFKFLQGALFVAHELLAKDKTKLDILPPSWFVSMIRGESVNNYEYESEAK